MNGETGKYPTSMEPVMFQSVAVPPPTNIPTIDNNMPEYATISAVAISLNNQQGVSVGANDTNDTQDTSSNMRQVAMSGNIQNNNDQSVSVSNMSLEQLKQMLSTQLEYYFSR